MPGARSLAVKLAILAVWSVGLSLASGCGGSTSGRGDPAPAAPRETSLGRQVATCLDRAGATIVRSPSELDFAKGTSLYGDAPSAGTDVVNVADGQATVSFMPDEGTWRIYTLIDLPRGMELDYDAIWAQIFDRPDALAVVAYVRNAAHRSGAQRCMNVAD